MNSVINKIFELFPSFEVLARKIYWSSDYLVAKKSTKKSKKVRTPNNCKIEDLEKFIDLYVKNSCSSIVIHSSYGDIKRNFRKDIKPSEIIQSLIRVLGAEKTICFPTHPQYIEEKHDVSYMKDEKIEYISMYNPSISKAWTGVLPNEFLKIDKVVRSLHPINSMAAIGPRANYYMENNISGEKPTACGINSSWKKLNDDGGFILGLGVDLVHSLTMIHVAEDTNDNKYSREKWYRERKFNIVEGDESKLLVVLERKPRWALYYTERKFKRDLLKNNIIKKFKINEFCIEYIENSKTLIDFINLQKNRYPYKLSRGLNNELSKK